MSAAGPGHLVRLVVPSDKTDVVEESRYARIYYIEAPCAPLNPAYRLVMPNRYLWPRTAIRRILQEERPDLVEICDKYTLPYLGGLLRKPFLSRLPFRPTVVCLSCEPMDDNVEAYLHLGRAGRAFSRLYLRWLYFPLCDHHIAVSDHVAEELWHVSDGHDVTRGVWVSPMGVDCERFTPRLRSAEGRNELCRRFGGDERTAIILYAGRLAPEKNLDLVFTTMERLAGDTARDYRLLIAGDGKLRDRLERRSAERLPGRVLFLGHVEPSRLAGLYANADVFVHPNPREPFGIAPLEAMAAGLALVAPDSGGVTSYANHQNAWLAKPDPVSFSEAVREVFRDPPTRDRKLLESRQTAERYSWRNITGRYLRLYRELHLTFQGSIPQPNEPARFYSSARMAG